MRARKPEPPCVPRGVGAPAPALLGASSSVPEALAVRDGIETDRQSGLKVHAAEHVASVETTKVALNTRTVNHIRRS